MHQLAAHDGTELSVSLISSMPLLQIQAIALMLHARPCAWTKYATHPSHANQGTVACCSHIKVQDPFTGLLT